MPFQRPTPAQLIDRAASDIESRLEGADARLRRNVVDVLARVLGGGQNGLYGYLDWQSKQLFPDSAEKENLDRWAAIWGVPRKLPDIASGNVVLTGQDGVPVPAGSVLQRSDGAQFTTSAEVTIVNGSATATVSATAAGSAGNTAANSKLTFIQPVSQVQSAATVDANGIGGGADEELDDSLRSRLLERIQQPPQGGSLSDYEEWALQQPGVTRAWPYPSWQGLGTVGLTFVMDGRANIIPLAADVTAMQSALDVLRPLTAQLIVFAPTPVPMNPQIHLNAGDTADIRSAVDASLADLIAREAVPGGTIYKSHIDQAISNATGEVDHQLVSPAADVVMAAGSISTLGNVTFV